VTSVTPAAQEFSAAVASTTGRSVN
jgi:hypothetical protein